MKPTRPRPQAWPFAAIPAAVSLALVAVSHGVARDEPAAPPLRSTKPAPLAPVPLVPGLKPERAGQEEAMVSLEVRFVDVAPEAWRLALETKGVVALGPDQGVARWSLDDRATFEVITMLAMEAAQVVQAPKVTVFDSAHATIIRRADKTKDVEARDGNDVRADISPTLLPRGTRVAFDLTTAGPAPGQVVCKGSCDLPEGSSVAVRLGQTGEKASDRPAKVERVVLITPRRVLTEAEEARIGVASPALKPISKPQPGFRPFW